MAEKSLLIAAIFIYLVLVSFLCASTFPETDVEAYGESMFYEPARTQNVSISSALNLSDLDLEVTRGRWILDSGALVSDSGLTNNKFFIPLYDAGGSINYSLSNVSADFCVYFYRSSSPLGRSRAYRYCFDWEDRIVTFEEVNYYLWIGPHASVVDSGTCVSLTSDSDVVIELTEIPGGTPEEGGVYSSVSVDGTTLLYGNYPEHYGIGGFTAGVDTKQRGFRVVIDRNVEYVDPVEVEIGFKIVPLMLKLIFFHAPELSLPVWLNLIMFKVPVLISVGLVITIVRGV